MSSQTVSVTIARPPATVAAFVRDPRNLPRWAAGLGGDVRDEAGRLYVQTPAGEASLEFAPPNDLGVLDHTVTLPDGNEVYVPMRVVPHGEGSVVVFTILRLDGVSDEAFAADVATVERDLATLKALMEK